MLGFEKLKKIESELHEVKTSGEKEKETLKSKHRQAEMERA